MWIKNLSTLSNEKLNTFLFLTMGVLERGLNKRNHVKIIEKILKYEYCCFGDILL